MNSITTTIEDVKCVVLKTLGIEDRAATIEPSTSLLGNVPELDSMAVLELVDAFQERFEIEIDDEDVTAEVFESLASLHALVESKQVAPQ